jgi:hypothetical protein
VHGDLVIAEIALFNAVNLALMDGKNIDGGAIAGRHVKGLIAIEAGAAIGRDTGWAG